MSSISDYIPAAVIIISIIASVIKNIEKKARKETVKTASPEREDTYPQQQERKTFQQNSRNVKPIQKESVTGVKPEKQKETQILIEKPEHITSQKEIFSMESPEQATISIEFENSEEVRRAIIYSEIFNRKEY
jgi:hypothetical protein